MSTVIPTSVYAELTPNPATMKFVSDRMLLKDGSTVEYNSIAEAKGSSELAEKLFSFPFVQAVFVGGNFVTVKKNDAIEWDMITHELREFIRDYLLHHSEVVTKMPEVEERPKKAVEDMREDQGAVPTEFDDQIRELLNEYVKPAVERDGGAIDFIAYKDGEVTVLLRGACSGCPSSIDTLKGGIENLLKMHMPQVESVVAYEG